MTKFAALVLCLCVGLMATVVSHAASAATADQRIAARLDALERENAALRARVKRLEASGTVKSEYRRADASASMPQKAWGADAGHIVDTRKSYSPRFEISGSLLYLQPGSGSLDYGTLTSPLPLVSPSWENEALKPKFSPGFNIGVRYMANESADVALNWTHLKTTTDASFSASPTQMVGPPFLIGPESNLYKKGDGTVQFAFDLVTLDAGYTFCADCSFQLRAFGGLEFARIGQDLTGTFQSLDGTASMSSTTHSLFTGIGPRLGMKGHYDIGDVQFIGEVAGAALIGTEQARIDFTTLAPAAAPNQQFLASPDTTRVVPSIDAKLATAYKFAPGDYGQFKVELGYRAAIFFDAVSSYSLTQVPTSLMLPPVGIYLATQEHLRSNFTNHGPYVTASWLFGQTN